MSNSATSWTTVRQAPLSFTMPRVCSDSVMLSNHLILCCPLLLLPSIFPSTRVFELALPIRWPKYRSFSFSNSPSSEYSELISFRIDWLDLSAVQGTLKSLLQHHNLKASILQHSAFFMVQLWHPYMTTRKTKLWLYGSLLAKWCLCFLICSLGLSNLDLNWRKWGKPLNHLRMT